MRETPSIFLIPTNTPPWLGPSNALKNPLSQHGPRCAHPVHGFRYGVVIVPSASFLFLTMMMCTLLFYIPFHSPSPNSETLSQGVTNRCRKPLTFMLPFTFSCFVVHDCRSPVYVRLVPPFFTHWARLHNSRHRDASGIVYLFLFFFLSISSCPRYCDGKNLSS